jgi:hypothetical protein
MMDEELAKKGEKDANGDIVKFKRQVVSMSDLIKQKNHLAMLYEALFGPENSCSWGTDDGSSLAGVKPKSEEDLREALRVVLFG